MNALTAPQVYASPYQPEYGSWAFQYPREQDRFFEPASGQARSPLVPVPAFPAVDVMMTHGPPAALLDLAASGQYAGCAYLLAALRRARPRLHCFGHIHEAYGALRVAWDEADEHARMTADADSAGAVQTGPEGQSSSGESQVDSQSWFGRGVLRKREQWPTEQDPLVLQSKPTHVKHLAFDQERALLDRCSSIDVTAAGGNPLHFGKESLVINASINNRRYRPANAPFLVSLDLPMA